MPLYRKIPVTVEARQWDGSAPDDLCAWIRDVKGPGVARYIWGGMQWNFTIYTLEGPMTVGVGDYVIKGVQGEFYPCKGDIFEAAYEEVI